MDKYISIQGFIAKVNSFESVLEICRWSSGPPCMLYIIDVSPEIVKRNAWQK